MPWRSHRMLCRAQPQCTEVTTSIYLCRIKPFSINLPFSSSLPFSSVSFVADLFLQALWEPYSSAPYRLLLLKVILPMKSDISTLLPKRLLQKKAISTLNSDHCPDLWSWTLVLTFVISEWGCYQSVGGEECSLSYLAVSLLLHLSMLWMQFCLYLWSLGKMLSTLAALEISIILLCRAHSSFNRTRQFKQILTESG